MTIKLSIGQALIIALMINLTACGVDLDIPAASAPDLQVRVEFINHHSAVEGHWSADIVSVHSEDIPESMLSLPHHAEQDLQYLDAVVPSQQVNFANYIDMLPGIWDLSVSVSTSGSVIVDVQCRIDVPASLGGAVVIGIKVIEGQLGCTSTSTGVGAPVTPARDIALLPFTVPPVVEQGQQISLIITALNYGVVRENFRIELADAPATDPPGVILPAQHLLTDLNPSASVTVTSQWNTAGASIGNHTLRVSVPALPYETDLTNNTQVVTVNIIQPPEHDLEVSGLVIPSPVLANNTYAIAVNLQNNGEAEETFSVMLEDTPPAGTTPITIGSSSPITLNAGASGAYNFAWNTTGALSGQHTLTARIPVLATGESSVINNTKSATTIVELHDVQTLALTAASNGNIGELVTAIASVRNNGNVNEAQVNVVLSAQPPGGGTEISLETQTVSINAGATSQVAFDWNTHCISPAGNYVLSATAEVINDMQPANNRAVATPTSLSVDHQLAVSFVNPLASVSQGAGTGFIIRLTNNNSDSETAIDLGFTDTPVAGPPGSVNKDPRLPIDIACGEAIDLIFTWFPPSTIAADHLLTTSILTSISGDDPADNSASTTVTVTP